MTNYEYIIQYMTISQFAKWLANIQDGRDSADWDKWLSETICHNYADCSECPHNENCFLDEELIVRWLEQEREDN